MFNKKVLFNTNEEIGVGNLEWNFIKISGVVKQKGDPTNGEKTIYYLDVNKTISSNDGTSIDIAYVYSGVTADLVITTTNAYAYTFVDKPQIISFSRSGVDGVFVGLLFDKGTFKPVSTTYFDNIPPFGEIIQTNYYTKFHSTDVNNTVEITIGIASAKPLFKKLGVLFDSEQTNRVLFSNKLTTQTFFIGNTSKAEGDTVLPIEFTWEKLSEESFESYVCTRNDSNGLNEHLEPNSIGTFNYENGSVPIFILATKTDVSKKAYNTVSKFNGEDKVFSEEVFSLSAPFVAFYEDLEEGYVLNLEPLIYYAINYKEYY